MKTLAVVHNNIDGASSIGAIARWAVRAGLARGWQVTAVCRDLDPELAGLVEHRPLFVPPRLHLLQWSVARPTVRRALRGARPDALLTYQAQIAGIADVWHVQYLSAPARRSGIPRQPGLRGLVRDRQAAGVRVLEDRYIRRLSPSPTLLFCSDGLQQDFERSYGTRGGSGVLYNPALPTGAPAGRPGQRRQRAEHGQNATGAASREPARLTVGFLGGGDPRKGGDRVVAAVAAEPDLFLVHAGPSPLPGVDRLPGRHLDLGHLDDVSVLLDQVDVLLVPSRFEPFGIVVAEAAARGIPVLVDPAVGAAPLVLRCGAGATWPAGRPLTPLVRALLGHPRAVAAGTARLAAELAPDRLADQLFATLDRVALDRAALDRAVPGSIRTRRAPQREDRP